MSTTLELVVLEILIRFSKFISFVCCVFRVRAAPESWSKYTTFVHCCAPLAPSMPFWPPNIGESELCHTQVLGCSSVHALLHPNT